MPVSIYQCLRGREQPGEVILYRVRNRLVDEWNKAATRGQNAEVSSFAIALVDHCLSQLRNERVNR